MIVQILPERRPHLALQPGIPALRLDAQDVAERTMLKEMFELFKVGGKFAIERSDGTTRTFEFQGG